MECVFCQMKFQDEDHLAAHLVDSHRKEIPFIGYHDRMRCWCGEEFYGGWPEADAKWSEHLGAKGGMEACWLLHKLGTCERGHDFDPVAKCCRRCGLTKWEYLLDKHLPPEVAKAVV